LSLRFPFLWSRIIPSFWRFHNKLPL
jgi:hypothetical protein